MAKLVAKRYAEALFEVALESNTLEKTKEEIKFIANIIEDNSDFKTIITHPRVSKSEKKEILSNILKDKISSSVLNFCFITIDKGRESYLPEISKEYTVLSNLEQGIIEAKAISAVSMSEEETNKLAETLSKEFNKTVLLETKVDKSILGGVLVRLGDKVIDGSVKGRLENLQKELNNVRITVE